MKRILFFLSIIFLSLSSYADIGIYASAVYLNKNGTGAFYNTLHSTDASQNIGNLDFPGNLGTFEKNSGTLKLNGGEIKSFKSGGGNVCSGTLYYRVYADGSSPGAFIPINLPFYANCDNSTPCNGYSGAFPAGNGGGCCNTSDQKWQETITPQIDLTVYPSGNYTLEIYYTITGNSSSANCDNTFYDSNYGNNYKAGFTVSDPMPVTFGKIEAIVKDNVLLVNWTTEKETDVDYYNILTAFDGNSFTTIGEMKSLAAAGNSNAEIHYSFSKDLNNSYFYLLGYYIFTITGIPFLLKRKNKIVPGMVLFCTIFLIISCAKDNSLAPPLSKNIYVKIVQVDKYNNKTESKIQKAEEE